MCPKNKREKIGLVEDNTEREINKQTDRQVTRMLKEDGIWER